MDDQLPAKAAKAIFSPTGPNWGGTFAANRGVILSGTSSDLDGLFAQSIGLSYSQEICRIYELGSRKQSTNVYYVGGPASGHMHFGHTMAPKAMMAALHASYSDVCKAANSRVQLSIADSTCMDGSSCAVSTRTELRFMVYDLIPVQIGLSVDVGDLIVTTDTQFRFVNLKFIRRGQ